MSVRTATGTIAGVARALADDGALIVRTAAGDDVRVLAGDVSLGEAVGQAWP